MGSVAGSGDFVGGLVGWNDSGAVTNSYWDASISGRAFGIGSDDDDSDNTVDSGETNSLPGQTTAELRQPTGYTGIYEDWNDLDGDDSVDDTTYWDFGTATQYPALKVDFNNDGTATWQEFGPQRAPGAVTNLAATRSATALTVTWDPPADAGSGVSGYEYRVSQDGGQTWGAWTDTAATSHTISDPPTAANYTVEVRADGGGAHGLGPVARIGPPGKLENLTLTPRNREIRARWRAPLDDGGSVITGYLVERDDGDGDGGSFTDAGHTGAAMTMTIITGLTNDRDYRVRVAARNVMGTSAYTMIATAQPSGLPFVSIAPGASPSHRGDSRRVHHSGRWRAVRQSCGDRRRLRRRGLRRQRGDPDRNPYAGETYRGTGGFHQ